MSEERFAELEKRLEILKWIARLGWALIAGAFGLGLWVAKLELAQTNFGVRLLETEIAVKNHGTEINSIHVSEARTGTDLAYIKAALERIEKKL